MEFYQLLQQQSVKEEEEEDRKPMEVVVPSKVRQVGFMHSTTTVYTVNGGTGGRRMTYAELKASCLSCNTSEAFTLTNVSGQGSKRFCFKCKQPEPTEEEYQPSFQVAIPTKSNGIVSGDIAAAERRTYERGEVKEVDKFRSFIHARLVGNKRDGRKAGWPDIEECSRLPIFEKAMQWAAHAGKFSVVSAVSLMTEATKEVNASIPVDAFVNSWKEEMMLKKPKRKREEVKEAILVQEEAYDERRLVSNMRKLQTKTPHIRVDRLNQVKSLIAVHMKKLESGPFQAQLPFLQLRVHAQLSLLGDYLNDVHLNGKTRKQSPRSKLQNLAAAVICLANEYVKTPKGMNRQSLLKELYPTRKTSGCASNRMNDMKTAGLMLKELPAALLDTARQMYDQQKQ